MTMIDTGTYGAKRQSTRKANPRDTLLRLMERYPSTSEEDLYLKWSLKVDDDADQIDTVKRYWFANNHRSLVMQKREAAKPPAQKKLEAKTRVTKVEEVKAAIKVRAAQMVLLDLQIAVSKGKKKALRDCTGAECLKAGGWLVNIGKSIKATDIVGGVMSEAKARKFWSAA
jgi:hypothetical protein